MSLYERLGLSKGSSAQEIRKAYLNLSRTQHPDKGGSEEKFKKLQEAYEILSDDSKRNFYDQTGQIPGEEVANGGQGGMPFPFQFDIGAMFGGMFPGSRGGGGPQVRTKRPKAPPKIHEFGLTLKDFFYGKKIQMKFERQKFCTQCRGEGAEHFESCNSCRGNGFREEIMMIGPGMQAMSRSPCGACNTKGRQPVKPCSKCHGAKFSTQEKMLEVVIKAGSKPGTIMKFENECSDHHDFEQPGDVHIILREADEPNSIFMRMGDDLSAVCNISFFEGLLGTERVLQGHPAHPDGIRITIPPGTIRADVVTLVGEGMPRSSNGERGNLLVTVSMDVSAQERDMLLKHRDTLRDLLR
jgi:DnaJ-class molecular chaperone